MWWGVEALDGALDLGEVLLLLEQREGPRVDGLEADVHVVTVRIPHELEQLGVVDRLRPYLGAPLRGETSVDHPAQELLHALLVRGEDVVREEDVGDLAMEVELFEHAADGVGAKGVGTFPAPSRTCKRTGTLAR